jgi:aspartyl-tRNA(Asn)/glutamyl-tRNA(Gln) amidotransferase subunit C
MTVGLDEVRRIATLARIGVREEQLPMLANELSSILGHMAVLQRVAVPSTSEGAEDASTPWRPDQGPPIPLLRPPSAFAPEMRDGFFIVPRLATHGGQAGAGAAAPDGNAAGSIEDFS